MKKDEYGEVINGNETYAIIAHHLIEEGSVIIGWTDQDYTHLDILFTLGAYKAGNLQGGVQNTDLFVSIMRMGAFGFEIGNTNTFGGYYDEKLGGRLGSTADKLAELINGVKKAL